MGEETVAVDPSNADQRDAWNGDTGDFWVSHADRFNEGVAKYHEKLLEAADIQDGAAVLDVGCGSGQTTRDAARRSVTGSVLGVDLSEKLLRLARELAHREQVGNVAFLNADAQSHPFPEHGFDRVVSRHGVMFFGDPVAAFANIAHALRPGGRLTLLTWQPFHRNEWISSFFTALAVGRELAPPPSDVPGPFALSDPGRVRTVLAGAGFADITLTDLREPMYFGPDPVDAAEFVDGMFGWTLRDLGPDDTARARAALRADLTEHAGERGVYYDSAAWLIEARRQ